MPADVNNIVRLAEVVDDVRFDDVEETLRHVQEEGLKDWSGEEGFNPTKVLMIFVDEHGGNYHTKIRLSSMKTSEAVAMLEIAKADMLREMLRSNV